MKVAILESLGIGEEELLSLEKPFLEKGVEFVHYDRSLDENVLLSELDGADAAIIANMPFPSSVIAKSGSLKFIDVAFTGTDHVGLDAAKKKGIAVSNASGYSNESCMRHGQLFHEVLRRLCQSGPTEHKTYYNVQASR